MARPSSSREIQVQKPAQSLAHFQTKVAQGQEEDGGLLKPLLVGVASLVALGIVYGAWNAWRSSVADKHEAALSALQMEVEGDGLVPVPAPEVEKRMRERLGRLEALASKAPWAEAYWACQLAADRLAGDRAQALKDLAEYKARFKGRGDASALENLVQSI